MVISSDASQTKSSDKANIRQGKRNSCPGARVVGSRIYDSQNGKTGHQNGVASPVKRGKENCLDGHSDVSLSPENVNVNEKPKKAKRVGLKEMHGMNGNGDVILKNTVSKKTKLSKGASKLEGKVDKNDDTIFVGNDGETIPYCEKNEGDRKVLGDAVHNGVCNGNAVVKKKASIKSCTAKDTVTVQKKVICEEIQLPQGTKLTAVAGVEVPTEDVGHALQFLEFCATFGKVLDVKRGEPGSVLRDLFCCRSTRSGKCSSSLQFQIKLLKVILGLNEDEEFTSSTTTSGGNAWLEALKECVSESQSILKDLPEDCFDKEDRYNRLDSTKKLKVLTFLCDEALGTRKLRNWIAEQNDMFAEENKQARGKLTAAKEKEKHVKEKMQDEIAKAILAKNGAPLTVSENEAIVLEIKNEAANAHAEVLEARGMAPEDNRVAKAVRIQSVMMDANGRMLWKLRGYSGDPKILVQDVGSSDAGETEKWFLYDDEQSQVVVKYLNNLRR